MNMVKSVPYILVTYFITGSSCAANYCNNFPWWQMVTGHITVTISKCVPILNHCDVPLKLIRYFMSIILWFKKKKKIGRTWESPWNSQIPEILWKIFIQGLRIYRGLKCIANEDENGNDHCSCLIFPRRQGMLPVWRRGCFCWVIRVVFFPCYSRTYCDLQVSEFPRDE